MVRSTLAAAMIGSASASMTCPGSPAALFHAGMEITTTAQASCADVQAEMDARVAGTNGWYDPHNRGTYSKLGNLNYQRVTGDQKYTDKMIFTLTDSGSSCKIEACSESQSTSFADFGTNYCNLKMLYCGSADGCKPVSKDFTSSGENTKAKAGASTGIGNCLKVEGLEAAGTCSLYEISGDTCGQSDLDCAYVGPAKAFRSTLKDGTCADQGYTVQTGTQTMTVPVIGDITVTQYSKGVTAAATCSLYEISGDTCGQSDLDCAYTGPAKAFRNTLKDGTCADQGYTVQTGTQTMTVPVIGDITVTQYSKGEEVV